MTSKTTEGRLKLVLIFGALSTFGPLSMDLYLPALPSLSRDLVGRLVHPDVRASLARCTTAPVHVVPLQADTHG